MDYKAYAELLMNYMILGEERGRIVQKNIREFAHGKLAILQFLKERGGEAKAGEISQKLKISTSRVAAVLERLEKSGYVLRVQDTGDRRCVRVFLTSKGEQYRKMKKKQYLEYCSKMLEHLGREEAKNYIRIMKRLSELLPEIVQKEDRKTIKSKNKRYGGAKL